MSMGYQARARELLFCFCFCSVLFCSVQQSVSLSGQPSPVPIRDQPILVGDGFPSLAVWLGGGSQSLGVNRPQAAHARPFDYAHVPVCKKPISHIKCWADATCSL